MNAMFFKAGGRNVYLCGFLTTGSWNFLSKNCVSPVSGTVAISNSFNSHTNPASSHFTGEEPLHAECEVGEAAV